MNIHAAENVPGPGVMPDHARTFVATAILPQRAQSRRANERQAGSLLTKIYKNEVLQSMQRIVRRKDEYTKTSKGSKGFAKQDLNLPQNASSGSCVAAAFSLLAANDFGFLGEC